MKNMVLAMVFAAVSTTAAPALAQTQAGAPATPQQAAKPSDADQVVCERQEETGSRLGGHKVCHTRAEWAQFRRDDRSITEHVQQERTMDLNGH